MFEYLENLSPAEVDHIKKTIQDLFRQTCLLQVKYNPVTLEQKDNPRYQVCMRHREFINEYVSVLGCELVYDPMTHIFRLEGEDAPVEHLNLFTTKLLILLKKIYYDKIMGEGLRAPITNLAELREYGADTSLLSDRVPELDWNEALNVLKVHQILEIPGAIANLEDDSPLYINPTINLYCASSGINDLLQKYSGEEPAEDESLAEQQKIGDMTGEEGEFHETGEEDLYTDVSE